MQWIDVCSVDDLQADSGVCALVEETQVALFYMPKENTIYAVNNYDPFSKVQVLSRGLIGDINGDPMVSSPIYKQHFNLETGQCFEDDTVRIDTYAVRNKNGRIEVSLTE